MARPGLFLFICSFLSIIKIIYKLYPFFHRTEGRPYGGLAEVISEVAAGKQAFKRRVPYNKERKVFIYRPSITVSA
jgi:hypothetical protein